MAQQRIIKLSKTSKMGCMSYALPARACKTGAKLRACSGTVCSACYACKGKYRFPNVVGVREANLAMLERDIDAWGEALAEEIDIQGMRFFRWHDSGDLQSVAHLDAIVTIARKLPDVKFWLPTLERVFVQRYLDNGGTIPNNLTIRLSTPMLDGKPRHPLVGCQSSCVYTVLPKQGFACPAPSQGGNCKACRACWDKDVPVVAYKHH